MRWDLACDYAINPLLIKDGLKPPPNTLREKSYDGMTAEEIYPFIDEFDNNKPMDHHIYDDEHKDGHNEQGKTDTPPPPDTPEQDNTDSEPGQDQGEQSKPSEQGQGQGQQQTAESNGSGQAKPKGEGGNAKPKSDTEQQGAAQPPPLTVQERESLSVQWKQRMAGAAQQALQAGKLDGDMARLVDFLLQPELPWRNLLSHYMSMTARDDYSYTRPSSRRGGPSIYPSLRSEQINIVVAVDTSGSISESEINEFVSEIDAIKSLIRARITLLACDAELAADCPWTYEPWDEFTLPRQIKGGGGTRFTPVYDWVRTQDRSPDLLVYFTDADGKFPDYSPEYPVIWLVKGKSTVPWGQRVQLN
jgi:predicted metal-dependent peptidase